MSGDGELVSSFIEVKFDRNNHTTSSLPEGSDTTVASFVMVAPQEEDTQVIVKRRRVPDENVEPLTQRTFNDSNRNDEGKGTVLEVNEESVTRTWQPETSSTKKNNSSNLAGVLVAGGGSSQVDHATPSRTPSLTAMSSAQREAQSSSKKKQRELECRVLDLEYREQMLLEYQEDQRQEVQDLTELLVAQSTDYRDALTSTLESEERERRAEVCYERTSQLHTYRAKHDRVVTLQLRKEVGKLQGREKLLEEQCKRSMRDEEDSPPFPSIPPTPLAPHSSAGSECRVSFDLASRPKGSHQYCTESSPNEATTKQEELEALRGQLATMQQQLDGMRPATTALAAPSADRKHPPSVAHRSVWWWTLFLLLASLMIFAAKFGKQVLRVLMVRRLLNWIFVVKLLPAYESARTQLLLPFSEG